MPNVTPAWNLPYPCPGDVVTAADFYNLDVALDEALSVLDVQQETVRTRPCIRWYRDVATVVATGVALNIVPTATDFSINWPTYNVVPQSGLYWFSAEIDAGDNTAATLTAEAVTILFSTYPGFIQVTRFNDSLTDIGMWKGITGIALLTAGETITLQYSPVGTAGNVTITFAGLQARMIFPT